MEQDKTNIQFLLTEYTKLREEQNKRIEFRDHMIYLTLGAIGAVFSFAIEKPEFNTVFLVLPFICIVLGWTYLSNDEKISSIGKYFSNVLIPKIDDLPPDHKYSLKDNWDSIMRMDKRRKGRKRFQLLIDLSIYCFSAILSIIAFLMSHNSIPFILYSIIVIEVVLVIFLAIQFFRYSEIK